MAKKIKKKDGMIIIEDTVIIQIPINDLESEKAMLSGKVEANSDRLAEIQAMLDLPEEPAK